MILYYVQCVDEWLSVNASCPTCRHNIINPVGGNADEAEEQPEMEMAVRNPPGGSSASVYSSLPVGAR